MTHLLASELNLSIAGVSFRICSSLPLHLSSEPGPYRAFVGQGAAPARSPDVAVELELGEAPPAGRLDRIFGDRSWSLYRDSIFYQLEFRSSQPDQPLWVARFAEDARRVSIYGSSEMLQQVPGGPAILNPVCYPLDQILLVYLLAGTGGLLVHAAGAVVDDVAVVFPGRSGAGKTTLARVLQGEENVLLLSDDRVVVRRLAAGFHAYGTPWPGEAGVAHNLGAPLAALLFLAHGAENHIVPISPQEALRRLLQVASIPWYNEKLVGPLLGLCEELLLEVPAYQLCFTPGESPAPTVRGFVRGLARPRL
ncbi:MAG TPA: hypothetical protein PKH89_05150 [Anaerolineae bacterium]|nr:hypothetical protein [Anaerolineae bacterium]